MPLPVAVVGVVAIVARVLLFIPRAFIVFRGSGSILRTVSGRTVVAKKSNLLIRSSRWFAEQVNLVGISVVLSLKAKILHLTKLAKKISFNSLSFSLFEKGVKSSVDVAKLELDDLGKDFEVNLKRSTKRITQLMRSDFRELSALLAKDISLSTPPFSRGTVRVHTDPRFGTKDEKLAGELSIKRDLNTKFIAIKEDKLNSWHRINSSRTGLKKFTIKTRNRGNVPYSSLKINRNNLNAALIHNEKYQDRISRSTLKGRAELGDPKVMVVTDRLYKKLYRELIRRVGRSKAVFAKIAMQLNPKRVPPAHWILSQFPFVSNNVHVHGTDNELTIKMNGSIDEGPGLEYVKDRLPYIIRVRERYILKQMIKKHGNRVFDQFNIEVKI